MDTLIIHSDPSKTKALAAFLKAFDIAFEIKKTKKNVNKESYNPEIVKTILESKQQYKDGKFTTIKTEDLWK
jgi:hypothetical protein